MQHASSSKPFPDKTSTTSNFRHYNLQDFCYAYVLKITKSGLEELEMRCAPTSVRITGMLFWQCVAGHVMVSCGHTAVSSDGIGWNWQQILSFAYICVLLYYPISMLQEGCKVVIPIARKSAWNFFKLACWVLGWIQKTTGQILGRSLSLFSPSELWFNP